MHPTIRRVFNAQQSGLILVILLLGAILTTFAGSHIDRMTGHAVNNFLNFYTLMQTATDASFFAIMAVGATTVIISGGIDLSVGSVYALAGTTMALALRSWQFSNPAVTVLVGVTLGLGTSLLCGLANGAMVVGLRVHPFIITLGTMWVFRGIAFVTSKAESILVPDALTSVAKATLGASAALYPVPMLVMIAVTTVGAIYLSRTVMGRHIYAIGGNVEASPYPGLAPDRKKTPPN